MRLSRQSIALVLTTKNKENITYWYTLNLKDKQKNLPREQNKLHPGLVSLLGLPARKWSGPYSYSSGSHMGPSDMLLIKIH